MPDCGTAHPTDGTMGHCECHERHLAAGELRELVPPHRSAAMLLLSCQKACAEELRELTPPHRSAQAQWETERKRRGQRNSKEEASGGAYY